jgi:hypothetical protein
MRTIQVSGVSQFGMFDTIIQFVGQDVNTGEHVFFAADHRPARDIRAALLEADGEAVLASVDDFMILRVEKKS